MGLGGEYAVSADPVDRPVAGGRHQPRAGVGGNAVPGPALGRCQKRFLTGILGEVEIAEEADQGSQHASPLVTEDLVDQEPISTIGRTSTEPSIRAAGIVAATPMAVSRSAASSR